MKTGRIINATVITPGLRLDGASVIVEGSTIKDVLPANTPPPPADWTYDANGAYVVPGFIDVHFHGAVGDDFTDTENPHCVETVAKAKIEEGVTSILPTTLTLPHETLMATAQKVAAYKAAGEKYAKIIGIHLEGPYVSPSALGAQNPAYARKPDIAEVLEIDAVSHVAEISYAVEEDESGDFASQCIAHGIVPSCGHTAAKFSQFQDAYRKGLRHLTHFCNQMTKLHHREIGIVGAGLFYDDVNIEMICDKIHLCPDMIRLAFKVHPLEHIEAITDSLRCSHLPDGPSSLGGLPVMVKNGEARLLDGNLAGSTLWMNVAFKNVHEVTGLPLEQIVRCFSWNQAIEQGLGDTLGRVHPGYCADLAVLDPATFDVKAVFVNGEERLRKD
jgi:N-acetylglucosamine-6-phosphate deacetylase